MWAYYRRILRRVLVRWVGLFRQWKSWLALAAILVGDGVVNYLHAVAPLGGLTVSSLGVLFLYSLLRENYDVVTGPRNRAATRA